MVALHAGHLDERRADASRTSGATTPFPAVDSNWDQPSRRSWSSSTTTSARRASNTLTFSYSANKIEITRGGENPGLNSTDPCDALDLPARQQAVRRPDRATRCSGAAPGYSTLWNEAPFRNNQDLFVLKDDYSAVFGKHLFKAGVLASTNTKNEDSNGNGSNQNSAFWGSAGLNGWDANTGNILADFLLRDMTWGFSESLDRHATKVERPRVLRRRLVEGPPARDRRLRRAVLDALQLLHDDDKP